MFKRKVKESNINEMPFKKIWTLEIFFFNRIGKSLHDAFSENIYKEKLIETFFFFLDFFLHSSFIVISLYTLFVVECDMLFLAELIPPLFGVSIIVVKSAALWLHRRDLFTVLRDFYTLWNYNKTKTDLFNKINKLLGTSKKFRYYYMSTIIMSTATFALRPIIIVSTYWTSLSEQSNSTFDFPIIVYPLKYPFEYQTIARYLLLILYEEFVNYSAACCLICDALYIQLMTHISINFLVLADDFKNANQRIDNDDNDNKQMKHMVKLVKKHRHMLVICKKVESIYNPIVFFTIIINGLDLCFCVIVLDKGFSDGNWALVAKGSTLTVAIFVQLLIYCNFSHTATEMTASIESSIYNSEWVNSSQKLKKMILMIMHASKGYTFTAYGVLDLNREQLSAVIQTTMSYFTLLRSFT